MKTENIYNGLVPKDNVADLETYNYFKEELPTNVIKFMDENGFDLIQIHMFKFKNNKQICNNISFHDLQEEREGEVYLHRADMEEFNKIKYAANSTYLLLDNDLTVSLTPLISQSLNLYNNRSVWYRFKKFARPYLNKLLKSK